MARTTMTGAGDVRGISEMLINEIQNSGMSCELAGRASRSSGPFEVHVLVFEKYYMRVENYVSLTVVVSGDGERVDVDAIGSGGSRSVLMNTSWGAEEEFESAVADILSRRGFRWET